MTVIWQQLLGLEDWEINVRFYSKSGCKKATKDGVYAECRPMWEYKSAGVSFNYRLLARRPHHIETTVIHELLHCIVNEMRDYALNPKHEERVVTNLEKAFHSISSAVCSRLQES